MPFTPNTFHKVKVKPAHEDANAHTYYTIHCSLNGPKESRLCPLAIGLNCLIGPAGLPGIPQLRNRVSPLLGVKMPTTACTVTPCWVDTSIMKATFVLERTISALLSCGFHAVPCSTVVPPPNGYLMRQGTITQLGDITHADVRLWY